MSIILFDNNVQKRNCEEWTPERSFMNIPCPFRGVFVSMPNCGKTKLCLNIVYQAQPKYEKIFLWHPEITEENQDVPDYTGVDYEPLTDIPAPIWFNNGSKKQLLIIDDVELANLNKEQRSRLNKVITFSSSHYHLSVLITSQDIFSQLPEVVLKTVNFFVVWPNENVKYRRNMLDSLGVAGIEREKLIEHMKDYKEHDFIVIDKTTNSPARFRKNMFAPVDMSDKTPVPKKHKHTKLDS
jgi:hypothetical protein